MKKIHKSILGACLWTCAILCSSPSAKGVLVLGLDAFDIAQSDGTPVSSWTSVANGGVGSATQGTANLQPTYVASSTFLGGNPAVRFDDPANDLADADGMATTVSGLGADYTIMALYAFRSTDGDAARVIQGGDGTRHSNNGAHNWLMGPYLGFHQVYDGGFLNSGSGGTTPVIATATGSSTDSESFYLNGTLAGSNNGTTTPNAVALGAEGAWAEAADSDLGLVLVFDNTLTDDERIGVEFFMAQAYGLAGFSATQTQRDAGRAQLGTFLDRQNPIAPIDITLDPASALSSLPAGGVVGTLSSVDANSLDTHTYTLVSGTGDTNNARFQIDGNDLKAPSALAADGGTQLSIRVRSTDSGALFFEKEITISVMEDSDSDQLPDIWEMTFTADLNDLTGLASGPGPGAGSGDFDNDGVSDLDEWRNGTNPFVLVQSGAALVLGLDARDIAHTDGTPVSNWTSAANGGVGSATQGTANLQPTYVASSTFLGGNPAVRFDDPVDDLVDADGMATTVSGLGADYTIIALYASRSTDGDAARVIQGGDGTRNSNNGANNWLMGPYLGVHQMYDGGFLNSGSGGTTPVIATATGSSTDLERFHLNGTLVGSNNGTTTPNAVALGAEGVWAEAADSDLGLVLIFDSALTDDERIGVEFYMAQAYGLEGFVASDAQKRLGSTVLDGFLLPSSFDPLGLQVVSSGSDLLFTWNSQAGKVYDLLSSTDPEADGDPDTWAVVAGREDIAATPDTNMLTLSRPGDAVRFYAIREENAPPPPPAFFDDFESVPNPDWTTGANGGDAGVTAWERGVPVDYASAGTPPSGGANGSATCFGTDLDADYGQDTDIYLRSPAIDLTAAGLTSATLTIQHFLDSDFQGGDLGSIRVLRASDLTQLGSEVASGLEGIANNATDWREFSVPLPVEALGETIVLEFQFTTDAAINSEFAGWYIDDVTVTTE